MTKNMIYKYTENKTRVRTLDETVESGTPLLADDGRPAVALTASGDATSTVTNADLPFGGGAQVTITYPNGGVSLYGKETTLAFDGTWEFSVPGATVATAQDTAVFITSAGELTLTDTGNTAFGHVDYPIDYQKRAGILPVRIGD